ncbi:hypothetical protein ACHAXT_011168 [Thalassiosira profunda]
MDAADATLLAAWREEQRQIASQAVVPQTPSARITAIDERYKVAHPNITEPFFVGGVDVSFAEEGSDAGDEAVAVYVILRYNDTSCASPEVVHRASKWFQLTTPYIPSYLAFREIEPLMELIDAQLQSKPDLKPNVMMVDGNGQWHERRAGIATFVGVRTGIPTVGNGKTFYSLDGRILKEDMHRDIHRALHQWHNQRELSMPNNNAAGQGLLLDGAVIPAQATNDAIGEKEEAPIDDILTELHQTFSGLAIPMKAGDEVLAYALVGHGGNIPPYRRRPRAKGRGSKNPIYISVGSNISLEDAVALCAKLSIARIPEPVREADLYGRQLVRERG